MAKLITPEGLRNTRKTLGITQGDLGSVLGVGSATVCRWETGLLPIPKMAQQLLAGALAEAKKNKRPRKKRPKKREERNDGKTKTQT